MTYSFYTISAILFVFAVLVAFLLVKVPGNYWFKWTLIPATLFLALFLANTIPDLMGRAFKGFPEGQFEYLAHGIKQDHSTIELWAKMSDGSTRLFSIPFNPKLAEMLDVAAQAHKQGVPIYGKFKNKKTNEGNSGVPNELQMEARPNPHNLLPPK